MRLPQYWPSLITSALVVSLGAVIYGSYHSIRELMLMGIQDNAFLEVRYQSSKIDQWLALQQTKVRTLAERPEVKSLDWSKMDSVLETEVKRFSDDFHHAFFVRPDGSYYFTGIGFVKNKNLSDRPYFQTAIAGKVAISDPLISRASGITKINVVAPVLRERPPHQSSDKNKFETIQFDGVLAAGVKIDRLQETIGQLKYGPSSYAFILNSEGKVVAHPDSDLIFNQDKPKLPSPDYIDKLGVTAIAKRLVRAEAGVDPITVDGDRQYIVHLPLRHTDWFVALVIPEENIDSQLRPLDAIALLTGIGSSILIIALGLQQQQVLRGRRALQAKQKVIEAANHTLEERVIARTTELSDTLQTLKKTQAQLVQNEKMSALGQVMAGLAHEINNPVNFIYGNLSYLKEYVESLLEAVNAYETDGKLSEVDKEQLELDFIQSDCPKLLQSMRLGAERIQEILDGLRVFSRSDEAPVKSVDLHQCIDSTLTLLKHRLDKNPVGPKIEIDRQYHASLTVECYAGQLNQVFMNLLSNAIDSVQQRYDEQDSRQDPIDPGYITITTQIQQVPQPSIVRVKISDNGVGMASETAAKIFDPFFTTKPVGKGTGLGLAIAYSVVVEKHGGTLSCQSQTDQGAEFYIEIPLTQTDHKAQMSKDDLFQFL